VARASRQRLRSLEVDAARGVGDEVEPADVRQDALVAMPSCPAAKLQKPHAL